MEKLHVAIYSTQEREHEFQVKQVSYTIVS